jgi:hypothetical protein
LVRPTPGLNRTDTALSRARHRRLGPSALAEEMQCGVVQGIYQVPLQQIRPDLTAATKKGGCMSRTVIIGLCLGFLLIAVPKSEASPVAHERACDLPFSFFLPEEAAGLPAFMSPPASRASHDHVSCDECPNAAQECDRICFLNRGSCVYSCEAQATDCALHSCICLPC